MLGFEITSDLLIVANIAQAIAIVLIISIIYLKIKKLQHKNISLNEKIEHKINNIESKLSYLYDQVLTISKNQDKFSSSVAFLDSVGNYRFKHSTDYESVSIHQLTDPTSESQQKTDSKTIDARLSTTPKPNNSENNSVPIPGTISPSASTIRSMYISKTSVPPITAKSSFSADQDSSIQVSTNHNSDHDHATAQDKPINVVQNDNESINKRLTDTLFAIEKNTNPEIEKIEQEILTTLKRLGGNDGENGVSDDDNNNGNGNGGNGNGGNGNGGNSNGSGGDDTGGSNDTNSDDDTDNLNTTTKKPHKKSEGFEREN